MKIQSINFIGMIEQFFIKHKIALPKKVTIPEAEDIKALETDIYNTATLLLTSLESLPKDESSMAIVAEKSSEMIYLCLTLQMVFGLPSELLIEEIHKSKMSRKNPKIALLLDGK